MMSIPLPTVLISTQPRHDSRIWKWVKHHPSDAILAVGVVMFAVYLAVYFVTGCWAISTNVAGIAE